MSRNAAAVFAWLLLPALAIVIPGCITRITSITAPATVAVDEEFTVVIDGIITGAQAGTVGLIIQAPDNFEFAGASVVSSNARKTLKRNKALESRLQSEEGTYVIALTESSTFIKDTVDQVRVLVSFLPTEIGQFPVKFISGVIEGTGTRSAWKTVEPRGFRNFTALEDSTFIRLINVAESEPNGTYAIRFSGERQYLTVPDTGFYTFSMRSSFCIEGWFATTEANQVLFGVRKDDFLSPYPLELSMDEFGHVMLTYSNGRAIYSIRSREPINTGVWRHIAVSYDSEAVAHTLFLDGEEEGATPIDTAALSGPWKMIVGSRAGKKKFYNGRIEELRFWAESRTVEKVRYYKNTALTGYEDRLEGLFNFDRGKDGIIPNIAIDREEGLVAYNNPKLVLSTAPIKVELLAFTVSVLGVDVELSWETFDETKIRKYEIERRTESDKYTVFQVVEPQRQPGNHQIYKYLDTWDEKQVLYYRLRRVDMDGSVTYSEEIPIGTELYHNFTLGDNQPNPFTAVTEIPFTITEPAHVTLKVYDLMGREVEELLSERKSQGTYKVVFDGSRYPPGMYFYKMRTATGSQTKKMYLTR